MIRFRPKEACGKGKEYICVSFSAEMPGSATSASEAASEAASKAASQSAPLAPSQASSPSPSPALVAPPLERPGCFKHVASNRSGSLSLYEDGDGHLVAIDPRRFC